jgi:phospholipase C
MDAPDMSYPVDIGMWNEGRVDAWNTARSAGMGMGHFTRDDLPFYYTLYESFVAGDQYFQSVPTCTDPNRLHLFSGSNGLSAGYPPTFDNNEAVAWLWDTMGELLERNQISWKVYQQEDNFDDNGFAWFQSYQNAAPGTPLYEKGMKRSTDLIEDFKNDMASGNLPQVSWIVGPANVSEHANWHPSAGEDFVNRVLEAFVSFPEIYKKSVMILNYDEGGQFYDHHWIPTPPINDADGISTVTTVGEITSVPLPVGPGFRVPLLFVSPWTRGNIVLSEIADHTSVIQFIETRFNVTLNTISPWRRSMMGDLTSAFDFENPDYSWPSLPDTSNYVNESNIECSTLPYPSVPAVQSFPQQETGTRVSRALPYQFTVSDSLGDATLDVTVNNVGPHGAPFILYDILNLNTVAPRKYAIEAGKSITDALVVTPLSGLYSFSLHGPNGFLRQFAGVTGASSLMASLTYDVSKTSVLVNLTNAASTGAAVAFTVVDNAYGLGGPWTFKVGPSSSHVFTLDVSSVGNWYDLSAVVDSTDASVTAPQFARRFMGRMETGKDTTTDPAMGAAVSPAGYLGSKMAPAYYLGSLALPVSELPLLPESHRTWPRRSEKAVTDADHLLYWSPEAQEALKLKEL